MIRWNYVNRFLGRDGFGYVYPGKLCGALFNGRWVILRAKSIFMQLHVTCGHRFFWRTFAIPVVLQRSLGYLNITMTSTNMGTYP